MGSTRLPPTFDPREEPGALAAHAGICAGRSEMAVPTATEENTERAVTAFASMDSDGERSYLVIGATARST